MAEVPEATYRAALHCLPDLRPPRRAGAHRRADAAARRRARRDRAAEDDGAHGRARSRTRGSWSCPAPATLPISSSRPPSTRRSARFLAAVDARGWRDDSIDARCADLRRRRASGLTAQQAELTALAREFGAREFAPRAARWDREASFPTDNYRDMHAAGLLAICVPQDAWRARRRTSAPTADRGRDRPLLRRDRADLEHACLLHAVDRRAGRRSRDEPASSAGSTSARRALHYGRSSRTARSMPSPSPRAARRPPARRRSAPRPRKVDGGWRVDGQEDLRLARRPRRLLRRALHRGQGRAAALRDTLYLAVPADARGRQGGGRLGPARHARDGLAQPACSRTSSSTRMPR